jgi:hypothetical protein
VKSVDRVERFSSTPAIGNSAVKVLVRFEGCLYDIARLEQAGEVEHAWG